MKTKKYLNIALDDSRISDLADVISNKTSKKIISFIADKESSESEISKELNIPATTVNYNIQKLLKSGLIKKSSEFSWSIKGKKIPKYKIANKKIIISPTSPKFSNQSIKILVGVILIAWISFTLKFYNQDNYILNKFPKDLTSKTLESFSEYSNAQIPNIANPPQALLQQAPQMPNLWAWFMAGGLIALLILTILNWRNLNGQ
ncbi:MAG: helix-turn-helix domain-containing protein [Candidatus Pacearchaeota archaeon]